MQAAGTTAAAAALASSLPKQTDRDCAGDDSAFSSSRRSGAGWPLAPVAPPKRRTSEKQMSAGVKFLIGVGFGAAALILGLALMFVILDQTGRLKAPSFANRLSFDEKLRYLRRAPPEQVEVLLLGSSTTLHGIDGAILREQLGIRGDVLNLGVQDLRVNQIGFLADVLLPQYPGVAHVIMISTTSTTKTVATSRRGSSRQRMCSAT